MHQLSIIDSDRKEFPVQTLTVGTSGELVEKRDSLIAAAKSVTAIGSHEEVNSAVEVIAAMKGIAKSVELARKAVKEPVLQLGTAIDSTAKKFVENLAVEVKRLEVLVGVFQLAEQRRLEAEAKARRDEEERKERARQAEIAQQEAERKSQEAAAAAEVERKRLEAERVEKEAEAARLALENASKNDRERLENEALEAEIKAEAAKSEAEAAAENLEEIQLSEPVIEQSAPLPELMPVAAPKVAGASVQPTYDIEVTDVHALYAAHRNCVAMEPRLSMIRELIKSGKTSIPGVKLTEVTKVAVRATSAASFGRLR